MKLLKGLLRKLKDLWDLMEKWHKEEEERRRRIAALPFWEGVWEDVKHSVKRYFAPLKTRWFWYYVFPIIVIFSVIMAYYDVYYKR